MCYDRYETTDMSFDGYETTDMSYDRYKTTLYSKEDVTRPVVGLGWGNLFHSFLLLFYSYFYLNPFDVPTPLKLHL